MVALTSFPLRHSSATSKPPRATRPLILPVASAEGRPGGNREGGRSFEFGRLIPPHPGPLPRGEGEAPAVCRQFWRGWHGREAAGGAPSPRGGGEGGGGTGAGNPHTDASSNRRP